MEENAMPVCEKLSEKQLFYTFQCYRLSKEPDLKDRVVRHFMPVAEREARRALRSAPQDMDRQDLVSYAILGMIEALEHYDPDRNPNMEGYVAAWIKGSLHKGIRTFLGKGRIRSKEGCSPLVFLSVEGQGWKKRMIGSFSGKEAESWPRPWPDSIRFAGISSGSTIFRTSPCARSAGRIIAVIPGYAGSISRPLRSFAGWYG